MTPTNPVVQSENFKFSTFSAHSRSIEVINELSLNPIPGSKYFVLKLEYQLNLHLNTCIMHVDLVRLACLPNKVLLVRSHTMKDLTYREANASTINPSN